MKASRSFLFLWIAIVLALLVVELAEVTRLFTLPVQSLVANPVAFVFTLALTTVLALVGAIFIGLYISQRWLTQRGFTPFEEEMLRMRQDLADLRESVLRREASHSLERPVPADPPPDTPGRP